jgi:hypothetical protein
LVLIRSEKTKKQKNDGGLFEKCNAPSVLHLVAGSPPTLQKNSLVFKGAKRENKGAKGRPGEQIAAVFLC